MGKVDELFICQCSSIEHQVIFQYFEDEKDADDKEVYVSIHLAPERNIFKRIWYAIRYIFGYRCRYGHFEEFIFNKNDAERLQKVVDFLKSEAK